MDFDDRYQALGIPYPDPETMCLGQCEGTGWVPLKGAPADEGELFEVPELEPELRQLWEAAEAEHHAADGWHFVVCPACSGTRLR